MEIWLKNPDPDQIVKILIINQEMMPVADCSSRFCGFQLAADKTEQKISLSINNIQLTTGIYSLAALIIDGRTKEIVTRRDGAAFFQMLSNYSSWATSIVSGEWKLLK